MTNPAPTKVQQIDQLVEHLKAARRIAYDLGLHSTVDMISKPLIAVEMSVAAIKAKQGGP